MSLEQKIKKEIADVLDISLSQVVDDARFVEDLGADSLNKTELIIALEANYGMRISDEEADQIIRVRDAVSFIENKLSKRELNKGS